MVGAAEIELDQETGEISVVDYAALRGLRHAHQPQSDARAGGRRHLLQGIGMALTENVTYDEKGVLAENSFLQYKIPTRRRCGTHPRRVRLQL